MGLAFLLTLGLVVFWASLVGTVAYALLRPPRRTLAWCVSRSLPSDPSECVPVREFEEAEVVEPDPPRARCPVWVVTGEAPEGPIVVFSHGWGESRQAVLQRLDTLSPLCSRVVAWDMPGQGEASPGPTRLGANEHRTLIALVEWLETDRPVVLMGFSMGGGVALRAASAFRDSIAGVIVEAPYRLPDTPARNLLRMRAIPHRTNLRPALGIAGALLGIGPRWGGFDRAAIAAQLDCPVLVLHGLEDRMCPPEDGKAIAHAARQGEFVEIPDAHHMNIWLEPACRERADAAVRAFLHRISNPTS